LEFRKKDISPTFSISLKEKKRQMYREGGRTSPAKIERKKNSTHPPHED